MIANQCELPQRNPICAMKLPEVSTMNTSQFYTCILNAKNKAEAGACMRKYISGGALGGFNDIPGEVYQKLENWFPLAK